MKNLKVIMTYSIGFLLFSALMFLTQWILASLELVVLNYKIHFLLFFVTLVGVASTLVVYGLQKKDIIGFVFLGFVVFKLFAIVYIALFEPDFKNNIVAYFIMYWLYLAVEVVIVVKTVKKQDESHVNI